MLSFMKTILNGLKYWINKAISKTREEILQIIDITNGEVQKTVEDKLKDSVADWNQHDETANNYIKNRPIWEKEQYTPLIAEQSLLIDDGGSYIEIPSDISQLTVGKTYSVVLNDVEYICVARRYNDCVLIGNGEVYGDGELSNGEPFCCDSYDTGRIYLNTNHGQYTFSLAEHIVEVKQFDEKYLPDNIVNGLRSLDSKMSKENPNGEGSFSMNRKFDSEVGKNSVAIGENTIASSKSQHVIGEYNIGVNTKHTIISEIVNNNTSSTIYISENYTFDDTEGEFILDNPISGQAKNFRSLILDNISNQSKHFYLIFNSEKSNYVYEVPYILGDGDRSYQVVGSKLYLFDVVRYSSVNTASNRGKYAHIIGNGTSDTKRSNAHTVDWEGNAWYAGDVYVGGTGQDDENAKKLATEEYVDDAVNNSSNSTFLMNCTINPLTLEIVNISHTYEEIVEAYNNGMSVKVDVSFLGLPVKIVADLTMVEEDAVRFYKIVRLKMDGKTTNSSILALSIFREGLNFDNFVSLYNLANLSDVLESINELKAEINALKGI